MRSVVWIGVVMALNMHAFSAEPPRGESAAGESNTQDKGATTQDAPTESAADELGSQPAESDQDTEIGIGVATGFLYKTVTFKQHPYAYCVYVPPEYTPDRAWPVVLFLHGSGERGTDGFRQTDAGIATAIRRKRQLCPAIVVMPQGRADRWWDDELLEMALKCVEDTSRDYHCDADRVYLTGLSMGGAGALTLGSRMPEVFAAVVPICGFLGQPDLPPAQAELDATAAKLARVPTWVFHGAVDTRVPVQHSRAVVAAVRAAGGDIQYTEYPQGKHNVWDRAYRDPNLWRWLLTQKRSKRTP